MNDYLEEINSEDFFEAENLRLSPAQTALPPSFALSVFKPETHYVQNGDINLAYQVLSEGNLERLPNRRIA